MGKMMEYKGYRATITYDSDDEIFVGKVFGIEDSLNFQGETVEELKQTFRNCIDNYLEMCAEYGKVPEKEYKGQFNIRITPELHRKISLAAEEAGISLNQWVSNALEDSVRKLEPSVYEYETQEDRAFFVKLIDKLTNIGRYGDFQDISRKVVSVSARSCC